MSNTHKCTDRAAGMRRQVPHSQGTQVHTHALEHPHRTFMPMNRVRWSRARAAPARAPANIPLIHSNARAPSRALADRGRPSSHLLMGGRVGVSVWLVGPLVGGWWVARVAGAQTPRPPANAAPPRTHPPTPPLSPLCHQAFKPPQRVEQVLHRVEAHDQRVVCERCQAPLLLCACMGVWAWW